MWGRAFGVRCHASVQSINALNGFKARQGTSSNTNVRVNRSSSSSSSSATEGSSKRKSSSEADRSSSSSSGGRIPSGSGRGRSNSTNSTGSRKQPGTPHGSSSSSSNGRVDRRSGPPPPRARDILLKPRRAAALETEAVERSNTSRRSVAVLPALGSNGSDDPTYVPRDPKVQDGPWSAVDQQLVVAAQRNAEQQARSSLAALPDTHHQHQATSSSSSSTAPDPQPAAINPQGFVLLGKTPEQLSALAEHFGQPKYRGKQVLDSILRGCRNVLDLQGLPEGFKEQLAGAGVVTGRSVVHHAVKSPDGTQKLLLQLQEGRVVETVGIPVTEEGGKQRLTVCVSSQVGCPMRCTFCATGKGDFARNLQAHEIVDQVMTIAETFQQRPTNVVFMGMGEPLLNIPAVVAAATYMREQMGMSGRSITISTVGVPNAMRKLAQYQLTATLAVSIHAPNQELREQLIPSAKVYPLHTLMSDCRDYFKATGRRVTFEYTLMGGSNDSTAHAKELAGLLRQYDLMSHVNLIPWNPVDESPYKRPDKAKVTAFREVLEAARIPVSVRTTRGLEAAAACGQLRNQFQKAQLQDPLPLL